MFNFLTSSEGQRWECIIMKSLKIIIALVLVAIMGSCSNAGKSQSEESSSKEEKSPIQLLFSSVDNLKSGIVGMSFASANDDCLIDMRRESRYKIFIRDNGSWETFNGEKYGITYDGNNQLCVEYLDMKDYGADKFAYGLFTPNDLTLRIKDDKVINFKNFRIITTYELEELYYKYK